MKLELNGIDVDCIIGERPDERTHPQRLRVDVVLTIGDGASETDELADTAHGRRPGFSNAARPEVAIPLYERVVAKLREALGPERVGTGRFGACMQVRLLNDGPFSVELLA